MVKQNKEWKSNNGLLLQRHYAEVEEMESVDSMLLLGEEAHCVYMFGIQFRTLKK